MKRDVTVALACRRCRALASPGRRVDDSAASWRTLSAVDQSQPDEVRGQLSQQPLPAGRGSLIGSAAECGPIASSARSG